MPRHLLFCLVALAALVGCKSENNSAPPITVEEEVVSEIPVVHQHAFSADINEADFAELVKTLSSDEFEGRGPGTAGEEKSVEYIRDQMQRIGLQPGNGDSWYQDVPMTETITAPNTVLRVTHEGQTRELSLGEDMVISTSTGQSQVVIDDSELVFVGYGVDAPEQNWNDYADEDWQGKTVVMFVNDPGFHTQDEALFEGKRMTYYGRWIYKFEEAARKGAAAALIVHDDAGASYGWDVVKNSWTGPQYDLLAADDPNPRLPAQGWISHDAARQLFADAGLDLDEAYKDASKADFKPMALNASLSLELNSTVTQKQSRNVIGVLPGSSRADEAVVYMAHWDHLGKREGAEGDTIYNGALDNATGVAGILEIAGAFSAQEGKPERSVVFLSVTLEESGLLGSQYYVAHPTFPLNKIAGVLNMDSLSIIGRARDMTVVGIESSELEDILKPIAAAQNRVLKGEAKPESGSYFRSDHFNFAKAGVPALYVNGGVDLLEGGMQAGLAAKEQYTAAHYHQPSDEYDATSWKLDGTIDDLKVFYAFGQVLAGSSEWPNWYEGNPFKANRDKMMAP